MKNKSKPEFFNFKTAVKDPTGFVGRENLIDRLADALSNMHNILLVGEKSIGKSSLLLNLSDPEIARVHGLSDHQILVYLSFKSLSNVKEEDVWEIILESINKQLQLYYSSSNDVGNRAKISKNLLVAQLPQQFPTKLVNLKRFLKELAEDNLRIHFLFDDFDTVLVSQNLGHVFLDHLRSFISSNAKNVSYIIAMRKGPSYTQENNAGSPFFNLFTVEKLGLFQIDEAYRLIVNAFYSPDLKLENEKTNQSLVKKLWSIQHILKDLTGYHPYLFQALCSCLYDEYLQTKESKSKESKWPLGDNFPNVLMNFAKIVKPLFIDLWTFSTEEEKAILSDLANHLKIDWDDNKNSALAKELCNQCLIVPTEDEGDFQLFSLFFEYFIKNDLKPSFINEYGLSQIGKSGRKRKAMHIITGAKGGVGKTLLALSSTLHYVEEGDNILCLDLNFENPDFSRILELLPAEENVESAGKLQFAHFYFNNRKALLLRPTNVNNIPGGAIGFWNSIRDALRESNDIHKFDPDAIVIDTNLHFASLLRVTTENVRDRTLKRIKSLIIENDIFQFNLWYVWTLASLHKNSHDPAVIRRNMRYFDDGLKDHFKSSVNFVHVLNPFVLLGPNSLLGKHNSEIPSFKTLLNVPPGKGIDWDSFYETASSTLYEMLPGHTNDLKGIFDVIGDEILKKSKNRRPENLFVIPIFDDKVVSFTDSLISEPQVTLEDIRMNLSSILNYINIYFTALKNNTKQ